MATNLDKINGTTQVRIGGYGGQGIILAGMLLGKAASLYDGKQAVLTQSYGPEARGGASNVDLIISEEPVDYPFVTESDILVLLFQEAYVKFRSSLKPGGTLIIESDLVHAEDETAGLYRLPATRMAEELGRRIIANVIVLGYMVGKTGVVSREGTEKAITSTVKKQFIELNLRAFDAGFQRAQKEA